MNFEQLEEHQLIADAIDRLLQDECSANDLRTSNGAKSAQRWSAMVDLGLMGLLLEEERGGLGANELALISVGKVCGKYALPEPMLDAMATVTPLLQALESNGSGLAGELLDQCLSGGKRLALVNPEMGATTQTAPCDGVLFKTESEWRFIPDSSSIQTLFPAMDDTRLPVRVLDSSEGQSLGSLTRDAESLISQRGALAASAELLGLGNRLLEMAVDYAQMREQFGKPIAGFQAVQHLLADVWIALRFATPVLNRAAWALANDDEAALLHVSHAKVACRSAADKAAKASIQVFGAMGYTYESDLHFWLKRVWAIKDVWGSKSYHEGLIAEELTKPGRLGPGAVFPHRVHQVL